MQRLRSALIARGVRGLIGLKRQFKIMDTDGNGCIDLAEFQQAVDDLKVSNVCDNDLKRLFNLFDADNNNEIDIHEFVSTLIGPLNGTRQRLVREAFERLDSNKNGSLDLDEVKSKFDPSRHPDVKMGTKTIEEARFEFFNLFTSLHSTQKGFTNDREVNFQDFTEYHQFINTQFEHDVQFRNFIVEVWNVDLSNGQFEGAGTPAPGKFMKNSREQWKYDFHRPTLGDSVGQSITKHYAEVKVTDQDRHTNSRAAGEKNTTNFGQLKGINVIGEMGARSAIDRAPAKFTIENNEDLVKRVSDRLKSRGTRGIMGLGKSFQIIDDDNSNSLSVPEFTKALKDYRITTDQREIQAVFECFDVNHDGQISYQEFLRSIVGEMNQTRRAVCELAFNAMDSNGNGFIELSEVKENYNAKKHPDVLLGKKSEDDVLYEFLDTFEAHYQMRYPESRKSNLRKVDLAEWNEYYNNISCSIDNDDYFVTMMTNAYNLNKTAQPKQAWGSQF